MLLFIGLNFPKRPNVECYGRVSLDAAWRAHERGDLIACACYLRESIRRYLAAWCEFHGSPPRSKYVSARKLFYQLKRAGGECCEWILEILETCNAVAHCERADCDLGTCLDIVEACFGEDFTREGGAW